MSKDIFEELREDDLSTFFCIKDTGEYNQYNVEQVINEIEKTSYNGISAYYYPYIEFFLNSPFFEEERKEKLKKHLGDGYKEYLFDKIFENNYEISLKINGVPYKVRGENKKINIRRIKEFLETQVIPKLAIGFETSMIDMVPDIEEVLFLINSLDFVEKYKDILPEKTKTTLEYLEQITPNILQKKEKIIDAKDDLKKSLLMSHKEKQPEKEFHINEKLKNMILSKLPDGFNKLEQSIWVYLKLCDCFSYDVRSYSNKLNLEERLNVKDIEKLSIENNELVCFEFTYALSDILSTIGIECIDNITYDFDRRVEDGKYDIFDSSHANLQYIIDDTIVFADSTTSILQGDISKRKFSNNSSGIRCENHSSEHRDRFKEAISKVKNYISEDEKRFNLDEIEREYANLNKDNTFDLYDKMTFLYNKIAEFPYNNIDLLAYITNLQDIIFEPFELKDRFTFATTHDNNDNIKLIMSVNKHSFKHVGSSTIYYLLDLNTKQIEKTNPIELNNLLKNNNLAQVQGDQSRIENLNETYLLHKQQAEQIVEAMANGQLDINGQPIVQNQGMVPNNRTMGFAKVWVLGILTTIASVGIIVMGVFLNK